MENHMENPAPEAPFLPIDKARVAYGHPLVIERLAAGTFVAAPSPANREWRKRRLAARLEAARAQDPDLARRRARAASLGVRL